MIPQDLIIGNLERVPCCQNRARILPFFWCCFHRLLRKFTVVDVIPIDDISKYYPPV